MICRICKINKPQEDFVKNKREKGGYETRCRVCKRSYDNAYYKDNIARRNNIADGNQNRRETNKQYVINYLKNHSCVDCGERDIIVLEFDHVNPTNKRTTVGNLLSGSLKSLILEIEKCDIRCANCHRRRHQIDMDSYRIPVA